jgi:hypothetical protein
MRAAVAASIFLGLAAPAGQGRAQTPSLAEGSGPQQASPPPAAAQRPMMDAPRGPRLEYTRGPSACLSPIDFATELRVLMRAPLRTDAPDMVKVWCSRGPLGFTCRVQHVDASGKGGKVQRIDGWDCWRVGRETALAVAEIAGFNPEPKPPSPPPEPCPTCPAAAPCRCPPERVCPLPPKPRKHWYHMSDLSLYAMALLTGGLWADPGAGVAAGIEVRGDMGEDPGENPWVPVASIALEMRLAIPGRVDAREPLDPSKPTMPESYNVGQFSIGLVPCARWKYFFGCGVIQPGFYWAEAPGYFDTGQPSLAFGPRAGVRVPLNDRFALFGFGEALFAPLRLGFASPPEENVFWLPSVAQGYGAVGVEVLFH